MRQKRGTIVYTYAPPEVVEQIEKLEKSLDPRRRSVVRRRQWALGYTGPMDWLDSSPQGGNANPKRKRKEYPSGHHNCGFYQP